MESDLSAALMAARTAATRQTAQHAIVKTQQDQELALVATLAEAVRAAPPPDQGKAVDKLA